MSAEDDYPEMTKQAYLARRLQLQTSPPAEMSRALDEINNLRRWKEEATEVIACWDECAALVPVQLGERKSDAVKAVLTLLLRDRGL